MKVITTCHKAGFEQYGHRWIGSMGHWPAGTEFALYGEGFGDRAELAYQLTMDEKRRAEDAGRKFRDSNLPLTVKTCEDLPRLAAFKAEHAGFRPPSWRHDIVRFSNKVFAAHDAFYDHDGIGVWLDADAVTYKPIPAGYIEEHLGDAFFAHFKRQDWYTETGMWIMNCRHPETKAFLDTWVEWFESGAYQQLHEWHDCTTLDATLKLFLKDGRITTRSLSGEFERSMHPMAKADIAKYIDHCKGPRKADGFSPENEYR